MQIEKKLILCSILAVAIGIAAIIPLQYLMNAETASALPDVKPWFDVNVDYAECNPYEAGNGTATWDGATIQAVVNFTLTADAMESDVDQQVEYYRFTVSTEQGPICDMGYYIAESKTTNADIAAAKAGNFSGVSLNMNDTITFKNGLSCNPPEISAGGVTSWSASWSGQTLSWTGDKAPSNIYGVPYMRLTASYNEDSMYPVLPPTIDQLRNAQTLSIDVSKICTVTVKGDVAVTTTADPTVLQHIELTKTDNGFVYGTYTYSTKPTEGVLHCFTPTLP